MALSESSSLSVATRWKTMQHSPTSVDISHAFHVGQIFVISEPWSFNERFYPWCVGLWWVGSAFLEFIGVYNYSEMPH